MTFSAVAEVHASASVIEDDILVVQASEQRTVYNTDPGRVPKTLSVLAGDTLVAEPWKHSAQKIDLDGTPMEGIVVLEPLAFSVPDVSLDTRPMAGKMDRKLLEHAVPEEDRTGRPMEGALDQEPLEHSVWKMHLDSRPGRNELNSGPLEHSVPDHTPRRGVVFCESQTVSDPLEHSDRGTSGDSVPKSATSELAEHSTSIGPQSWGEELLSKMDTASHPQPAGLPGVAPESQRVEGPLWKEIEYMIDTGCQVTILSTMVFERMCVVDPTVRSKLQPCRRRLVSADSSPLMVQGQLELAIVFPGLCCDMLFVVANNGSDGLLGTEALQSYLPHQLDLRTGQLWADGWSKLQLHQQRLTPKLDGILTTSVVIPPDSEIVANLSVSGIRPNGCALVEPSRCLTEEYGVVVGHTLVDASSGSGSVLIVDSNAEVVVLPSCTCIGKLVPVAVISVALEDPGFPKDGPAALWEYLEEIVAGSHPSLGDAGQQLLRDLLFHYSHVFLAPGEPVTGRTTTVQHDIVTTDARPVRCGPRRLAPAGLRKEQTCVQEMLHGGK